MNFNSIQNIQNIQKKKRKYDNFTSDFERVSDVQSLNPIIRENKRLRLEVFNLNNRIKLLETHFQMLSLEVSEINKRLIKQDEIPSELKMFYYT